jgi:O-antigen ligase
MRCAIALACGVAFWYVGHSLQMSLTYAVEQDLAPDQIENRFAKQQAVTTPSSAFGFALLGGVGLTCWALSPTGRSRWNSLLLVMGAAYVGWCLISMVWSIDHIQSLRKSTILLLTLAGAFGVASRLELEDLVWVTILVLGALVAGGVLIEVAYGTFRPWRHDYRFSGTVHPNDQGVQCALLALAGGLAEWRGRDRPWLRASIVTLGLAGLWFTESRTTLAALVAAAAVAIVMRARGIHRWLVVAGCLMAASLGGVLYNFVSVSALEDTADVASMGRRENVNTLTGRLPLWEELEHAARNRMIKGHGYGAFWNSKNILKYSKIFSWHIPHAHSAYLDLILAVGVVGMSLYILWVFASAAAAAQQYENSRRRAQLFALCLFVFSLVHGATESKFPGAGLGTFVLFTAMAMVMAPRRQFQLSSQSLAEPPDSHNRLDRLGRVPPRRPSPREFTRRVAPVTAMGRPGRPSSPWSELRRNGRVP